MNMYDKPIKQIGEYILKRFCMLIAKLTGLKSLCLALATVLLCLSVIESDVWLTVIITVICSSSGLKLAENFDLANKSKSLLKKDGNNFLSKTEKRSISNKNYIYSNNDNSTFINNHRIK